MSSSCPATTMLKETNLLLVISGPSGAGKSTLCDRFVTDVGGAENVVTATTRPRRKNEVDGRDYYFLDAAEFQRRIDADEFLEYAEVHGNFYGSPLEEVRRLMGEGKDVILEIDVQGGLQVRKRYAEVLLVYVTPSDLDVLRRRLETRGTESQKAIEGRIAHARHELQKIGYYDYVLINDDLGEAIEGLRHLVQSEKRRVARYDSDSLVRSFMDRATELDVLE